MIQKVSNKIYSIQEMESKRIINHGGTNEAKINDTNYFINSSNIGSM